ncbi:hypothetical protein DMB44_04260 [Thermoplasma sp. Kam2015]|uniref:hypothetical protein n=1 Tax=Thermoplasma sp. Kam2015 TaxID=2094122 RepID=UPI000D8B7F9D|nr:hypothetical protein [Thermoplasma sp. Kam2015]PYB68554.1 hypothetical protein DMB44_04260 [Thermoplasma sp. Kam2015]
METEVKQDLKFSILLKNGEVNDFAKAMGPLMALNGEEGNGILFVATKRSLRAFRMQSEHIMLASVYLDFKRFTDASVNEEINFPVSYKLLSSLLKVVSIGKGKKELRMIAREESVTFVYFSDEASLEYHEEYNEEIEIREPKVDYPYGSLVDAKAFVKSLAYAASSVTLTAGQGKLKVSYDLGDTKNTTLTYELPIGESYQPIPEGAQISVGTSAIKVMKSLRHSDGLMIRFKPAKKEDDIAPLKIGYKNGEVVGYLMIAPMIKG